MFQIRQEQLDALTEIAIDGFQSAMVEHLREVFLDEVRPFTDDDVRLRAKECIARAAGYGLVTQYQVLCFVDATYLVGEHFDTDPKHAWARELLTSPLRAEEKADCLLETACGEPAAGVATEEVS